MKKLTSLILVILLFNVNANCQEYYKIENTSQVIRYYKNLKDNTESISDSISMRVSRKGEIFYITLNNQSGKLLATCEYRFTKKYVDRVFVSRNATENGNELIKSKKKIKVLEPVNDNCIKRFSKL